MKRLLMLVVAATVGLGTMNAWAVDTRILPGMMCQKIDGNGTPSVGWQGAMNNLSTSSSLRLSCPIVRDNVNSSPSGVAVSMFNNTVGAQACCQFYFSDFGDQNTWWASSNGCIQNSALVQVFSVPASNYSDANGTEFLFCTLPSAASGPIPALIGYEVSE